MANAEPLNIRLSGPAFEPTDLAWRHATPAERLNYWRHLGEFALDVKRQEIRKGIGIDGRKLKPVKPTSRPDGAKGPPLIPHYAESRTARLLAVHVMVDGVTLFWRGHGRKSWAKILGYHAYKHGPRALPVRNTIGISERGIKKIVGNARDWWTLTHRESPTPSPAPAPLKLASAPPTPRPKAASKPPAPPRAKPATPKPTPTPTAAPGQPARPPGAKPGPGGGFIVGKVHYLAPGQKANPLSKYIQVASSGRAPKPPAPPAPAPPKPRPKPAPAPAPKPKPKPKPAPTPAAPKPIPPLTPKVEALTPKPVPPPAPKPATPLDAAVAYARAHGVQVERNGFMEIARANGAQAVDIPAVYRSSEKKIFLNETHPYWKDPAALMGQASAERWFSSGSLDHIIVHETGHALHHRAVDDSTYFAIRKIQFTPAQATIVKTEVSRYAATKPVEFVAEMYAGLMAGKTYSDVVMRLYAKLGGPKVAPTAFAVAPTIGPNPVARPPSA